MKTKASKTKKTKASRTAKAVGSGPLVRLLTATGNKSCDNCEAQEGGHYCLLHSMQVKNMNLYRCRDWSDEQPNTKIRGGEHHAPNSP